LYSQSVTGPLDDWARIAYSLGAFLYDQDRIDESIEQHETALDMYRAMSGSGDVYMNQVLEAYGWSLREAGRYEEAVAAIEESITLRPAGFADERVCGLHWNLGGIHHHRGEDGRALDEYDESLALRCEILARRASGYESTLKVHALRLRDHEHDAEFYGDVFAVLDAVAPIRQIVPWTVNVAAALETTQGRDAADTLLRRVVSLMNDQGLNGGRETSTDIARARSYLGARLVGLKHYETAEDQLHEAYEVLRRVRGESCPYTRNALVHLIRLYDAWDNPAASAAYRERLRKTRPR
jgi:tetratricopeptide (TPR) repeat protein